MNSWAYCYEVSILNFKLNGQGQENAVLNDWMTEKQRNIHSIHNLWMNEVNGNNNLW